MHVQQRRHAFRRMTPLTPKLPVPSFPHRRMAWIVKHEPLFIEDEESWGFSLKQRIYDRACRIPGEATMCFLQFEFLVIDRRRRAVEWGSRRHCCGGAMLAEVELAKERNVELPTKFLIHEAEHHDPDKEALFFNTNPRR